MPGTRASTVHSNVFEEGFTALLHSKTPMGFFLHSMLSTCAARRAAPLGQVWPMPLPYPEVHTSRRSRLKSEGGLKIGMNYIVAVLNWLYLGEKVSKKQLPPLGLGTKLNRDQWKVVNRLRPLLSGWLDGGVVTPDDMGRAASKVEAIEVVLEQLESAAAEVSSGLRAYSSKKQRFDFGSLFADEEVEVVGATSNSVEHAAKDIEPDRLKFIGVPSFDPCPYLDYANRAQYTNPFRR